VNFTNTGTNVASCKRAQRNRGSKKENGSFRPKSIRDLWGDLWEAVPSKEGKLEPWQKSVVSEVNVMAYD